MEMTVCERETLEAVGKLKNAEIFTVCRDAREVREQRRRGLLI